MWEALGADESVGESMRVPASSVYSNLVVQAINRAGL